jgi:hypothetical protein
MNPDKPQPDESSLAQPHPDLVTDAIPILSEPLDLPPETAPHVPELRVDLGYAELQEHYTDSDDLGAMDEIQTLPLAEMVLDDGQDLFASPEHKQQIATLESIVFEGDNPNALAPKTHPAEEDAAEPEDNADADEPHMEIASPVHTAAPLPPFMPPPGKPLPTKSDNPFLPQHILDRLNQGKRNLVEEIAQSSAALDASTAILRTHARAERLAKSAYSETKPQHSFSRDKSTLQKQKMIDDLVEEYLPLLASELRRRLRKLLDE